MAVFVEPFSLTTLWRRCRAWFQAWWSWPASIRVASITELIGLGLVIGAWVWLWSAFNRVPRPSGDQNSGRAALTLATNPAFVQAELIYIDVSGAVKYPGVYQLKAGQVVAEAVAQAGGLVADSDYQYLNQKLNLAQTLEKGSKIYIPFQGERSEPEELTNVGSTLPAETSTGKVSLNTATAAELDALPGVGEKRAQDILENRPYQSLDELVTRKIVTQSVFDDLKDQLTL